MARWGHIGAVVTVGLATFLFPLAPVRAEPAYIPLVRDYVEKQVRPMVETPLVLKAIAEQNAKFGNVSEMDMRVLDETYRSEVDQHQLHMVTLLLDKSVSHYLKARQDTSQGAILEFFRHRLAWAERRSEHRHRRLLAGRRGEISQNLRQQLPGDLHRPGRTQRIHPESRNAGEFRRHGRREQADWRRHRHHRHRCALTGTCTRANRHAHLHRKCHHKICRGTLFCRSDVFLSLSNTCKPL